MALIIQEVFMEIDKNLSNQLKKIVNSNEGLKEMLKNADKSKVEEMMKGMDFSSIDMRDVMNKIQNENPENLAGNLKNIMEKYFGGKNG